MTYVYDILLNFNKDLLEYFEWEESDNIKYIKKIILFKISPQTLNELIKKEIVFSEDFLKTVPNYEMNGIKEKGRVCLFTDGLLTIGVLIKDNKLSLYSRMLLDEEREVLELSDKLETTEINYQILSNREISKEKLTRKEKIIKEKLELEIEKLYIERKYETLFYLYYEYTNIENRNIDYIYQELKKSLNSFNHKHKSLFEVLLLSKANTNIN